MITRLSVGPLGSTGVMIGYITPSSSGEYVSGRDGISENEVLTIHFLYSLANSVEAGLATINLAVDGDDYILAQRPDKGPSSNGIAGEGRVFSIDQIQKSDQGIINTASSYVGYKLHFAADTSPSSHLNNILQSYNLDIQYNVDLDVATASPVLQAVYSNSVYYERIAITSAPIDRFPSLAFANLTKTAANGSRIFDFNNTELRSVLGSYDWNEGNCYFTSSDSQQKTIPYTTKYGSGIVGKYAIFHAPDSNPNKQSSTSDQRFDCGSQAVIWGKSVDGKKDILVQIQTMGFDLDQLQDLARSLPIR